MTDPNPAQLLREWQAAMESALAGLGHAASRSDAARHVLGPLQRQLELVQRGLERQQELQRQLMDRAFEPVDTVFDLLESSGAMMREQSEALQQAAQGVQRAAELMQLQAELFERATRTARWPADAVRGVSGASPRRRRTGGGEPPD